MSAVGDASADPPLDRLRVYPDGLGQVGRCDAVLQQRRAQSLVRHPARDSRVRYPTAGRQPERARRPAFVPGTSRDSREGTEDISAVSGEWVKTSLPDGGTWLP